MPDPGLPRAVRLLSQRPSKGSVDGATPPPPPHLIFAHGSESQISVEIPVDTCMFPNNNLFRTRFDLFL